MDMPRPVPNLCQMASRLFTGAAWEIGSGHNHRPCNACGRKVSGGSTAASAPTALSAAAEAAAAAKTSDWGAHRAERIRENRDSRLCSACRSVPRLPRPAPLAFAAPPTPEAELLKELGISPETFRKLRQLEARDVTPNDYDLLLRLHAKPCTKTREMLPLKSAHNVPRTSSSL